VVAAFLILHRLRQSALLARWHGALLALTWLVLLVLLALIAVVVAKLPIGGLVEKTFILIRNIWALLLPRDDRPAHGGSGRHGTCHLRRPPVDFSPLLAASPVIQIRAVCAVLALLIGALQLFRRKGDRTHRGIGRAWVVLMAVVALSSFFIWTIRLWGLFSPIHLI